MSSADEVPTPGFAAFSFVRGSACRCVLSAQLFGPAGGNYVVKVGSTFLEVFSANADTGQLVPEGDFAVFGNILGAAVLRGGASGSRDLLLAISDAGQLTVVSAARGSGRAAGVLTLAPLARVNLAPEISAATIRCAADGSVVAVAFVPVGEPCLLAVLRANGSASVLGVLAIGPLPDAAMTCGDLFVPVPDAETRHDLASPVHVALSALRGSGGQLFWVTAGPAGGAAPALAFETVALVPWAPLLAPAPGGGRDALALHNDPGESPLLVSRAHASWSVASHPAFAHLLRCGTAVRDWALSADCRVLVLLFASGAIAELRDPSLSGASSSAHWSVRDLGSRQRVNFVCLVPSAAVPSATRSPHSLYWLLLVGQAGGMWPVRDLAACNVTDEIPAWADESVGGDVVLDADVSSASRDSSTTVAVCTSSGKDPPSLGLRSRVVPSAVMAEATGFEGLSRVCTVAPVGAVRHSLAVISFWGGTRVMTVGDDGVEEDVSDSCGIKSSESTLSAWYCQQPACLVQAHERGLLATVLAVGPGGGLAGDPVAEWVSGPFGPLSVAVPVHGGAALVGSGHRVAVVRLGTVSGRFDIEGQWELPAGEEVTCAAALGATRAVIGTRRGRVLVLGGRDQIEAELSLARFHEDPDLVVPESVAVVQPAPGELGGSCWLVVGTRGGSVALLESELGSGRLGFSSAPADLGRIPVRLVPLLDPGRAPWHAASGCLALGHRAWLVRPPQAGVGGPRSGLAPTFAPVDGTVGLREASQLWLPGAAAGELVLLAGTRGKLQIIGVRDRSCLAPVQHRALVEDAWRVRFHRRSRSWVVLRRVPAADVPGGPAEEAAVDGLELVVLDAELREQRCAPVRLEGPGPGVLEIWQTGPDEELIVVGSGEEGPPSQCRGEIVLVALERAGPDRADGGGERWAASAVSVLRLPVRVTALLTWTPELLLVAGDRYVFVVMFAAKFVDWGARYHTGVRGAGTPPSADQAGRRTLALITHTKSRWSVTSMSSATGLSLPPCSDVVALLPLRVEAAGDRSGPGAVAAADSSPADGRPPTAPPVRDGSVVLARAIVADWGHNLSALEFRAHSRTRHVQTEISGLRLPFVMELVQLDHSGPSAWRTCTAALSGPPTRVPCAMYGGGVVVVRGDPPRSGVGGGAMPIPAAPVAPTASRVNPLEAECVFGLGTSSSSEVVVLRPGPFASSSSSSSSDSFLSVSVSGDATVFVSLSAAELDLLMRLQAALAVHPTTRPLLGNDHREFRAHVACQSGIVDGDLVSAFFALPESDRADVCRTAGVDSPGALFALISGLLERVR